MIRQHRGAVGGSKSTSTSISRLGRAGGGIRGGLNQNLSRLEEPEEVTYLLNDIAKEGFIYALS